MEKEKSFFEVMITVCYENAQQMSVVYIFTCIVSF